MSEIKKALEAAREIVDACAGDNRPAAGWASEVRAQIDAALSSAAFAEREPMAKPKGCVGEMTGDRAIFFLERFKREEKMLGPHEQWSLDVAISALCSPSPTSELESENSRLRKEQDAMIEAAVIAERESCAFAVECHSGFGDPETIETCAQIVRDRCDPALRSDSIHLDPERYAELEAAENRLTEALKALEPFAREAEHHRNEAGTVTIECGIDECRQSEYTIADLWAARRVREGAKADGAVLAETAVMTCMGRIKNTRPASLSVESGILEDDFDRADIVPGETVQEARFRAWKEKFGG